MRKSMPIIPVTKLQHLIEGVDKLVEENNFSAQTVKILIYEFSNEFSILSVEIKNEEKPLWLKALDVVVPPASSKLQVQPEEENVTSTFAEVKDSNRSTRKKVKTALPTPPKPKKKKKRVPVDDVFDGIDDEILGE